MIVKIENRCHAGEIQRRGTCRKGFAGSEGVGDDYLFHASRMGRQSGGFEKVPRGSRTWYYDLSTQKVTLIAYSDPPE